MKYSIHFCRVVLGACLLYTSPHRQLTIARELTKLFETIHTGMLEETLTWLQADTNQQKGEFVLLLSGAEILDKSEISEHRCV